MTKQPPELGAIEWHPLPPKHGLPASTVGIRHVGPRAARRWSRQIQRLRREEDDRIRGLRRARVKAYDGDAAAAAADDPHLFADPPKYQTPDADEAYERLFDDMAGEAVAGLDQVEDPAYARRLMEYLAPGTALELIVMILDQQSLCARQSFCAEDPGVAQPGDVVADNAP